MCTYWLVICLIIPVEYNPEIQSNLHSSYIILLMFINDINLSVVNNDKNDKKVSHEQTIIRIARKQFLRNGQ